MVAAAPRLMSNCQDKLLRAARELSRSAQAERSQTLTRLHEVEDRMREGCRDVEASDTRLKGAMANQVQLHNEVNDITAKIEILSDQSERKQGAERNVRIQKGRALTSLNPRLLPDTTPPHTTRTTQRILEEIQRLIWLRNDKLDLAMATERSYQVSLEERQERHNVKTDLEVEVQKAKRRVEEVRDPLLPSATCANLRRRLSRSIAARRDDPRPQSSPLR